MKVNERPVTLMEQEAGIVGMPKTGVLLINIGTPDAPDLPAVKRYLAEFLTDPLVIDLPWIVRWPLVHGIILRKRAPLSTKLYQQIWTEAGSPLLVHSKNFAKKLQEELGSDYVVALGMRYGNPDIQSAWDGLRTKGIEKVIVFPLYPQYSLAATHSALKKSENVAGKEWSTRTRSVKSFYENSGFIEAYAAKIQEFLNGFDYDHILFSYHGLPKKQVKRTEKSPHCMRTYDCCEHIGEATQDCYRAQCFATTRALCWKLKIPVQKITVSFQSRIGAGWITPFTDRVIEELGSRQAKRVAIVCPSFVTDCLETLEEVGIRMATRFCQLGGGELRLVPALNADPLWVTAASQLVRDTTSR